jgi:hypothetical protein
MVRNQSTWVLYQAAQNSERFRCQSNVSIFAVVLPAPQTLINHVEPELKELFYDASR